MAGLVPAIHVFRVSNKKDVDARDKPTSVRHGSCMVLFQGSGAQATAFLGCAG
jgi:hypothetical protein